MVRVGGWTEWIVGGHEWIEGSWGEWTGQCTGGHG